MRKTTVVLSRNADADDQKHAFEDALGELFANAGLPVLVIPHIYHLAEDEDLWQELNGIGGLIVCLSWLYPRPAEWLLRRHGLGEGGGQSALIAFDMSEYDSAQDCCDLVMREVAGRKPSDHAATVTELGGDVAQRWYPVVDYSRCVNCQQCLQFCLFGVYDLDDAGEVIPRNPDNCKPGCPACSRICPRGAIMFPLYDSDEAIAGAPGRFMTSDPTAKAMFYAKTNKPCPICGRTYEGRAAPAPGSLVAGDEAVCAECGMPLERATASDDNVGRGPDDLDSLIDDLEQLR